MCVEIEVEGRQDTQFLCRGESRGAPGAWAPP